MFGSLPRLHLHTLPDGISLGPTQDNSFTYIEVKKLIGLSHKESDEKEIQFKRLLSFGGNVPLLNEIVFSREL